MEPLESQKMNEELKITAENGTQIPDKSLFLDEVVEVEKNAWPEELQAPREKFASRLEVFPDGFFIVRVDSKAVGVTTSQIVNYDPRSSKSWDEITGNGLIKKTHDQKGNALYVVSVGVSQDAQGQGIGSKLVELQKELAQKKNLKYLFLGARIPGYDNYCLTRGNISPKDYLKVKREDDRTYDDEIRFYERNGLIVSKIIPKFEPDPPSRGYGVVMVWENPDYSQK